MKRRKMLSLALIVLLGLSGVGCTNKPAHTTATVGEGTTTDTSTTSDSVALPANRIISGTATDLGEGTFTVGTDIPVGVYDVISPSGGSNLIINNSNGVVKVTETLETDSSRLGVSKVRVTLLEGDTIELNNINKTHFEPVSTPFVTTVEPVSLYSGSFVVGQDVCPGTYIVTDTTNHHGSFMITDSSGSSKIREILGDNGINTVTVNLVKGDIIKIINLEVTLAPSTVENSNDVQSTENIHVFIWNYKY